MPIWEGLTEDEARDLNIGDELMMIPQSRGEYGYGDFSTLGLQFMKPKEFIYEPDTKLDFDKFLYLVRVK